ncbi:MAG TPA: hypothetical protein VFG15_30235 [Amycolatopsis sp.]|nr:hypothetical protein [Amycolatopsis sp.]
MHPTIGRMVHYMARGSADGEFPPVCRAAVVTEADAVDPERVGLCVLNPGGLFFRPLDAGGCEHDEVDKLGGTWHWPERVEGNA